MRWRSTAWLLAAMTAGSWVTAEAQDAAPIRVGTIYPMSGPAGPSGIDAAAAVKVEVDLINAAGGLLGRKLVLSQKDDESTPAVGVSKANELIGENADVIFEGRNSPVSLAMQPIIAAAGILDITCSAKADAVLSGRGNPDAIRIISSNSMDAEVIAGALANTLGAKRVALLVQNDAYGNDFRTLLLQKLAATGKPVEVVASEKFAFSGVDFRVPLTSIKAANPDVVVLIDAATSGMSALVQQYRQAGIGAQALAGITLLTPEVVHVSGDLLNGFMSGSGYLPELAPLKDIPAAQAFEAAYRKQTGRAPGEEAGTAAQAVTVWATAVRQAGSLAKPVLVKVIRGQEVDGTIFGKVRFSAEGQMQTPPSMFRVINGTNWTLGPLTAQ